MRSRLSLTPHLTTHSTGARVSLPFIVNLAVSAARRARLIRALESFVVVNDMSETKQERTPLNAEGDFYVLKDTCITCLSPEHEAPELMGLDEATGCYFKRQPKTLEELEHAIEAVRASCVEALRYAGSDPEILERLRAQGCGSLCDVLSPPGGRVRNKFGSKVV